MKFRPENDQLNRKTLDSTSKVSDAPVSKDDMLSKMIQIGIDNNLQKKMTEINSTIDILKYNHGISVREHLGFGNTANSKLRFFTDSDGSKCIGKHNSNNNLHGRAIAISTFGGI